MFRRLRANDKRRPPTIRDVLIVVMMSAVGTWWTRAFVRVAHSLWPGRSWAYSLVAARDVAIYMASLTLFVLALPQPHESMRRLARRPGFLATIATLIHGIMVILLTLPSVIRSGRPGSPNDRAIRINNFLFQTADARVVAPMIVLAWAVGSLIGLRWRDANWVESLARVTGCIWVASCMASILRLI